MEIRKMDIITSKSNQYIKKARSLQEKKYRDQEGLYLIEGLRLAEEAVAADVQLSYGFATQRLIQSPRGSELLQKLAHLPIFWLDDGLLAYCTDTVQPQGILLVAPKTANDPAPLLAGGKSFWILADHVQDPGNLGAILRTGWAAGADGVIIMAGGADPYNPKTVRASMGAIFNLPLYLAAMDAEALALIKKAGLDILVAAAGGQCLYHKADLCRPMVWVLGSEAEGASRFWKSEASTTVRLPMSANVESLNVSVAGGILFYETLRQRTSK